MNKIRFKTVRIKGEVVEELIRNHIQKEYPDCKVVSVYGMHTCDVLITKSKTARVKKNKGVGVCFELKQLEQTAYSA